MKRFPLLLSLLAALFTLGACSYDTEISVDASADLYYAGGDVVTVHMVTYDGFHHKALSTSDLEYIFTDLIKNVNPGFSSAMLYVDLYDAISGSPIGHEEYGVVYSSQTGHYDFALMSGYD